MKTKIFLRKIASCDLEEKMYAWEAARQKGFGTFELCAIELQGETDLESLKVSDFQRAKLPLDISFNPFRIVKSSLKQLYEIGINEKLTG